MSRRIDGAAVALPWRAPERRPREDGRPAPVAFVDGKPLPIGGLGPLPAWVRGLERVRTWVWAKPLINAVRIRYG